MTYFWKLLHLGKKKKEEEKPVEDEAAAPQEDAPESNHCASN